jgi:alpha-ribazole phosphatase
VEIILIRHTPTAAPAGTCYGASDIALRGESARDIAALVRRTPSMDHLFTSTAQRCTLLATALGEHFNLEAKTAQELCELHFGMWEGRQWEGIARSEIEIWAQDTWERSPPGGESERALWGRVKVWFDREVAPLRLQRIAIVAHAGPLRVLRCLIGKLPSSERWDWSIGLGDMVVLPMTR